MAVKFSQFNIAAATSDIDYVVGYKSTDNVQIPIGLLSKSYQISTAQSGLNEVLNLTGSDGSIDTITFTAGANITLTDGGAGNGFTIQSKGNVEGAGSVNTISKWSATDTLTDSIMSETAAGGQFTDLYITVAGAGGGISTQNLEIGGFLLDSNGQKGTAGQILSSTGALTDWITPEAYDLNSTTDGVNVDLNLTSASGTDNSSVKLVPTGGITISQVGNVVTLDTSALGTISDITAASPLTGGGSTGTVNIGIQESSAAQDGYLSSTDWTTFNNKVSTDSAQALTSAADALTLVSNDLTLTRGDSTTDVVDLSAYQPNNLDIATYGSDLTGEIITSADELIVLDVSTNTEGRMNISQLAPALVGTGLDASLGSLRISSNAAGDGLSGGSGVPLAVNVDNSSIEISGDELRIKAGGITNAELQNSSITINGTSVSLGDSISVGTVTEVSSTNFNTLIVSNPTGAAQITAVTGTVNSSSLSLATGQQIQTAIDTATTGALKFISEWSASGTGGGTPDLQNAATHIPGSYYIVSAAGSAVPNGAGTEPNSWAIGDWVVRSDLSTDTWQKIDNTQVGNVTGSGTANQVALWNSNSNITSDGGLTFDTAGNHLTIGGDLNVLGGDIVLSGTGRIQGIDTVSAPTDAVNKAYVDASPAGTVISIATGTGLTGGTITASGTISIVDNGVGATQLNVSGNGGITEFLRSDSDGSFTWAVPPGTYSLPVATNTVLGGIELFSNTDNPTAANSVSSTAGRTYGLQLNSANQGVINVPWTDTNTIPNNATITLGAGTGISGGGNFTTDQSANETINFALDFSELTIGGTLAATDYLIAENGGAENRQLISSIPLSIFNNNAGWTSNVGDITGVTAGTNLTGGGTSGSVTLNMATGGIGAGTYGSTANGTKIDNITVDAYGRVTGITTGATGTGTVTSIATGTGLTGGTITGTGTISIANGGVDTTQLANDSVLYSRLGPEFTNTDGSTSTSLNFAAYAVFTRATNAGSYSISSPQPGTVKQLIISNGGSASFSLTGVTSNLIAGSYDNTKTNFIQIAVQSTGIVWFSISQV